MQNSVADRVAIEREINRQMETRTSKMTQGINVVQQEQSEKSQMHKQNRRQLKKR